MDPSIRKFQITLTSAGEVRAEFKHQHPSSAFLDREQAFNERARTIEALRQRRTNTVRAVQESNLHLYEIVLSRGHWRMLHNNRHSTAYADQAAAILASKVIARKKRALGLAVEVRLIRSDGQVVVQSLDGDQDE